MRVKYQSDAYRVVTDQHGVWIDTEDEILEFEPTPLGLARLAEAHQQAETADADAAYYAAYVWLKAHLNTLPSVQNVTPTQWSIVTQRGDGSHIVTRQEDGGYILHGVRYDTLSSAVASVMEVGND
jgi:hypothetical protein